MEISVSDIKQHIVQVGIDVYPQVTIPDERTRLNLFFEEARATFPKLCRRLTTSDNEFRISGNFSDDATKNVQLDTFVLTSRGPVIMVPLHVPGIGETSVAGQYQELSDGLRDLFFRCIPERKIMRFGMVRKVVFETGNDTSLGVLRAPTSFNSAALVGGRCSLLYRDDRCNVRITIEPLEAEETVQVAGAQLKQHKGYGLGVMLDVCSNEIRAQNPTDITSVIERAESLWPDPVLTFIQRRGES